MLDESSGLKLDSKVLVLVVELCSNWLYARHGGGEKRSMIQNELQCQSTKLSELCEETLNSQHIML